MIACFEYWILNQTSDRIRLNFTMIRSETKNEVWSELKGLWGSRNAASAGAALSSHLTDAAHLSQEAVLLPLM